MRRHLWLVLAVALVAGGVAIAIATASDPDDFGWFAYTPLSSEADWQMTWDDATGSGSSWLVSTWQVVGAAMAALGLLVIASGVAYRLGRRRGAPPAR